MLPVVGIFFDGANVVGYLLEGEHGLALVSAAAMIPFVGQLVTAGKISVKAGKKLLDRLKVEGAGAKKPTDELVGSSNVPKVKPKENKDNLADAKKASKKVIDEGVGSLTDATFAQVKAKPNKAFSGKGQSKYTEVVPICWTV